MLRIAVLGAGRISRIHAADVAANPQARRVLIADPWWAGVDELTPQPGCNGLYDCAAASARDDIDTVLALHRW